MYICLIKQQQNRQMTQIKELSTEEKIIKSAAKIFTEKGYDGARTREIAEDAGINLALLNYYFRSKEKLFSVVMTQKMEILFGNILPIISDKKTFLEEKIEKATSVYLDMLLENPNLPLFVASEIRKNNSQIKTQIPIEKILKQSKILQQIQERIPNVNPFHFLMNFLGMVIFPFIAKPVYQSFIISNENEFRNLVEERRKMIPLWLKILLENTDAKPQK